MPTSRADHLALALAPLLMNAGTPRSLMSPRMPEGLDRAVYAAAFLARFPTRRWSLSFAELKITAGADGVESLRVADAIQAPGEVWLLAGALYFLARDEDGTAQARFILADSGVYVRARALPELPRAALLGKGVLVYRRLL